MNDFITLYYPTARRGETLFLELSEAPGAKAIVYAASPIKQSLQMSGSTCRTREEYRARLEGISSQLSKVGGFVAGWDPSRFQLKVFTAGGKYRPPVRLVVLGRQDDEPRWVEVPSGESLPRAVGDRLILPLDGGAEDRLDNFFQQLEGLPEDLRPSVLTALRIPSLEARVEQLEALTAASGPLGATKKDQDKVGGKWKSPLLGAGLALAAVLLLGTYAANWGNADFSWIPFVPKSNSASSPQESLQEAVDDQGRSGEDLEEASDAKSQTPTDPQPIEPPPPDPRLVLEDAFSGLMAALAAVPAPSNIQALYQSHFKQAADKPYAQQIADPDLAWGMAKLHAAMARISLRSTSYDLTGNRSDLKEKLLATPLPAEMIPSFAYFSCQAFDQPGLPAVPGDRVEGAHLPDIQLGCSDFDFHRIADTVRRLTGFVETGAAEN